MNVPVCACVCVWKERRRGGGGGGGGVMEGLCREKKECVVSDDG